MFRPETEEARLSFLRWYQNDNTKGAYEQDIMLLFRWCEHMGLDPLDVTRQQLEGFTVWLRDDRGNCMNTVKRRLSVVRHFYNLTCADGVIPRSPGFMLRIPKVPYTERKATLDRWELGAVIHTAKQHSKEAYAIVSLMGILGLRLAEVCSLNVEDISGLETEQRITFTGKGSKVATMPLPLPVLRAVAAVVDGRIAGPLILGRDGQRMHRVAMSRLLHRIGRATGLEDRLNAHDLRRACITSMIVAGVPIADVRDAARHSNFGSLQAYYRPKTNLDRHGSFALAAFISGVS